MKKITICTICPCPVEYRAWKKVFAPGKESIHTARPVFTAHSNHIKWIAMQTGFGKTASASGAQWLIDMYSPDLILDTGSSGALSDELKIGDTLCGLKTFEYDMVPFDEFEKLKDKFTFLTLADGNCQLHALLADAWEMCCKAKLFFGNIASGEKNVNSPELKQLLNAAFNCSACTWESSAVTGTANLNQTPVLCFRTISDFADENMKSDFIQNWNKVMLHLYRNIQAVFIHFAENHMFAEIFARKT